MTEDSDASGGSPVDLAAAWQSAGEDAINRQLSLVTELFGTAGGPILSPFNVHTATFKARVQSGGRISIPDAEREVLDIEEGDVVQTVVLPVTPPVGEER